MSDAVGASAVRMGLLAELEVQKRLLGFGLDVLTPITPDAPFDCVARLNGAFSRVQIKSARPQGELGLKINTYIGKETRRGLTSQDCDVIVAYAREANECYVCYPNGKTSAYFGKNLDAARLQSSGQIFPAGQGVLKPVRGIQYVKRLDRWAVELRLDGKKRSLGSYPSYEDAVAVVAAARAAHAENKEFNRGDFGWSKSGRRLKTGADLPD